MKNEIIDIINKSFIDDNEKMIDFFTLNKEEFLKSYSYVTEEEWEATRLFVSTVADLFRMYNDMLVNGAVYRHRNNWDPKLSNALLGEDTDEEVH